jgi:hypothetical protein
MANVRCMSYRSALDVASSDKRWQFVAMASSKSGDPLTFGSAEVRFAARVSQGAFDSWLLRHLPLASGHPGKGAERRFSMLDAIKIATIAELVGLGLPASAAASYSGAVRDYSERTIMVLQRRDKSAIPTMRIVPFAQVRILSAWLTEGATILDLSRIAANTRRILGDPATKHLARMRTTSGWAAEATGENITIEVHDPSAAPERKRVAPARGRREPAEA